MQHTFVLHTQNSVSFVLRTQKARQKKQAQKSWQKGGKRGGKKGGKKGSKKGGKKAAKNIPKKHTAIYTTHMLIIRKNFLKHIPEPVLLLS